MLRLWHQGRRSIFDAAAGEIVEHLIGGDIAAAGHGEQFFHVVGIEVGDAPGADLAGCLQRFEGLDGFGKRIVAAPMQQVEVDAVGAEPFRLRSQALTCRRGWHSRDRPC